MLTHPLALEHPHPAPRRPLLAPCPAAAPTCGTPPLAPPQSHRLAARAKHSARHPPTHMPQCRRAARHCPSGLVTPVSPRIELPRRQVPLMVPMELAGRPHHGHHPTALPAALFCL